MRFLILLAGAVCLTFFLAPSCTPQSEQQAEPVAEEAPSAQADVEAIEDVNDLCLAAIKAGDTDAVVGFFADDAVVMRPNEPAIRGTAAIDAWLRPQYENFHVVETWSSEEIVVFGDWAFERANYTFTMTSKEGGEPVAEDNGKYLMLFERQADGSWKYARFIYNSDNPSPPPEEPTT